VNYDTYAEGEALLGWFNGTFQLDAASPFDGNQLLVDLARGISKQPEIAHFKTTLAPDDGIGDLAALNLVAGDREPELSHRLQDQMTSGELIVNLRAEADPELLRDVVLETLAAISSRLGVRIDTVHMEHFRPARPVPTYRMATGGD
jgi:hypothetical protein